MKLTAHSVKHHKSMDEETRCFEMNTRLDGRPFARVTNNGQGGEDRIIPLGERTMKEVMDGIAVLDAALKRTDHAAQFKANVGHEYDFAFWCDEQVENQSIIAQLRSAMKSKAIFCVKQGEMMQSGYKDRRKPDAALFAHLRKAHGPDLVIYNELPMDEVLAHYQANVMLEIPLPEVLV